MDTEKKTQTNAKRPVFTILKWIYWVFTFAVLAYSPVYYLIGMPPSMSMHCEPWMHGTTVWVYLTGLLVIIKSVFMLKNKRKTGFAVLATGVLILVFRNWIGGIIVWPIIGVF